MKTRLIENLNIFLLKKGFTIKNLTGTCFDVFARNNNRILLIKVLEDANSINKEYCEEMNKISSYIQATPLILSEKAGSPLQDNVVYSRFNIVTLNLSTLKSCINNKLPVIKRTQAGLTASLDGKKLRSALEEYGYSMNSFSKKIGVTTKMVVKYEHNDSEVTLNRATKIYDIFGEQVFKKIDIFSQENLIQDYDKSKFSKKFMDLGFDAADTKKAPFDIIAKRDKELILTEVGDKRNDNAESLSRLLDADNLVIFKKKKPKDIPAVTKEEFMEFERATELIKFLKEF